MTDNERYDTGVVIMKLLQQLIDIKKIASARLEQSPSANEAATLWAIINASEATTEGE